MNTPFDDVIRRIVERGYHNHRKAEHSDIVCKGIWADLLSRCEDIREDHDRGEIGWWLNQPAPDLQRRRADLLVCEIGHSPDLPDLSRVRICLENKSVITAHRNKGERFRDLDNFRSEIQQRRREAIVLGTVLIGTAGRYLNVADQVRKLYRSRPKEFEQSVLPRLSTGDDTLWDDFPFAISENRPDDAEKTLEHFQCLPTRTPNLTHQEGFDYLLMIPVHIDNVNPPRVDRDNTLGLDVDEEYTRLLNAVRRGYIARWHI